MALFAFRRSGDKRIYLNTERLHLFSPDIHVGVSVRVNRVFEDGEIIKALALLEKRHPLLSSTVDFDKDNAAYYKLNSARPIVPVFVTAADSSVWRQWMDEENRKPFDFAAGSLMKILVLKAGESTVIAALGHHLLGDGLSFVFFMRDLLKALDNTLDEGELMPPIIQNASDIPKAARLRFPLGYVAKALGRAYRKSGKRFTYADYAAVYDAYRAARKPATALFSLSRRETETLIGNCRTHGVTVNEAVATAFFAARKRLGISSDTIGVSCNIRSEMPADPRESMGNFVSGIKVTATYDETMDLWRNARIVGDVLNGQIKNTVARWGSQAFLNALDDTLQDALNFVNYEGHFNAVAKKLCDAICGIPNGVGLGISNLGKRDMSFNSFSADGFYFIPPLFPMNDFIVGAITVNGILSFCLRYPETRYDREHVEKVYAEANNLLFTS
jgi:hypothetical protein